MSLSSYDNQINALGKQIDQCEGAMIEFNKAMNRYIDLLKNYETASNKWQAASAARANWETASAQFIETGRKLPQPMIWHNNTKINCETGVGNYTVGIFKANCNDAPGTTQAKCTSCGYSRCDCTALLDGWCKGSRCEEYRTLDADVFRSTTYYADWLKQHPEPPLPGPRPSPPPVFPVDVNMACTSCTQNVVMSDLTSTAGSLQFQRDSVAQAQNCMTNLNVQKSTLESQKAAAAQKAADEAKRAADEAAARKAAEVAAAAEAERVAAQKAAAEAAAAAAASQAKAAANTSANDSAAAQKAAVDAARAKTKQQMILFIIILIMVVAIAILVYQIFATGKSSPNNTLGY